MTGWPKIHFFFLGHQNSFASHRHSHCTPHTAPTRGKTAVPHRPAPQWSTGGLCGWSASCDFVNLSSTQPSSPCQRYLTWYAWRTEHFIMTEMRKRVWNCVWMEVELKAVCLRALWYLSVIFFWIFKYWTSSLRIFIAPKYLEWCDPCLWLRTYPDQSSYVRE